MTVTAQTRAIRAYRSRMQTQGITRFELLALESDRDLLRSLAKRLTKNDPEAVKIRQEVARQIADPEPRKGGILAALRRSPLVGADLQTARSTEQGRIVDL